MKQQLFERVESVMKEALDQKNADAIVAVSPENVIYLSGISIVSHRWIPLRLVLIVFHREADPTHVICDMQEGFVRSADGWIRDIRVYPEFAESPIHALVDVLKEKGLRKKHILVEKEYLSASYAAELQELLPECEVGDCSRILDTIRMVKTKDEVELLRENARMVEEALLDTYSAVSVGETEKAIGARAMGTLLQLGYDAVNFISLTTRKTIYANVAPSDYCLSRGDMLRVDMIGSRNGYKGDIMRQAIMGRASPAQADSYKRFVDCLLASTRSIVVGARPCDIYRSTRRTFEAAGLAVNMPMIGHGLGVGLHEHPSISPLHEDPLVEDMVFNFEPMGVDPQVGGFAQELTIHVTAAGPVLLSDFADISVMHCIGR
jgi:Xaa-Pro aminopeptidase